MNESQKQLGLIVGKILRHEEFKLNTSDACNVMSEAYRFDLLLLVYDSIAKFTGENAMPDLIFSKAADDLFENVQQSGLWRKAESAFEANGVDIIMLKGIYLKSFYPEPDSRKMSDIDLIYNPKQRKEMKAVMSSLGFKEISADSQHIKFFNAASGVTFEMHHTASQAEYYESGCFKGFSERAVKINGFNHIFRPCDDDTFLYALIHLKKHIMQGEFSLRRLCDIYVLQLSGIIPSENANNLIRSLGLDVFYDKVTELCRYIFEGTDSKNIESLADAFFDNLPIVYNSIERSTGEKLKYYLKQLFPHRGKIFTAFPFIDNHRWLLPFGYLLRIIQCLGPRRKNLNDKLSADNKEVVSSELDGLQKEFGLNSEK